jgi:DNA-binding FadR family transcriptional regulator
VLEAEAASRAALRITDEELGAARAILDGARTQVFAEPVTDHETVMGADIAFHRVIANASGNGALAALIDALADRTMLARRTIGLRHEEQVRTAFHDHEGILAALTAHEPDRVRLLMSHHLLAIEDFIDEDDSPSASVQ